MSLYYLILWNQVDILQKGSCPYARLDEVLRYVQGVKRTEQIYGYITSAKNNLHALILDAV